MFYFYYIVYPSFCFNFACTLNLSSQKSLIVFVCITCNLLIIVKSSGKFHWPESLRVVFLDINVGIEDWLTFPSQGERNDRGVGKQSKECLWKGWGEWDWKCPDKVFAFYLGALGNHGRVTGRVTAWKEQHFFRTRGKGAKDADNWYW